MGRKVEGKVTERGICLLLNLCLATPLFVINQNSWQQDINVSKLHQSFGWTFVFMFNHCRKHFICIYLIWTSDRFLSTCCRIMLHSSTMMLVHIIHKKTVNSLHWCNILHVIYVDDTKFYCSIKYTLNKSGKWKLKYITSTVYAVTYKYKIIIIIRKSEILQLNYKHHSNSLTFVHINYSLKIRIANGTIIIIE